MTDRPSCWCGNADLIPFSAGYLRCARCETLVWGEMPGPEITRVVQDEAGFYGRDYWFSHQESDLGHPNIRVRARTDLPERCVHWLRTLLRYTAPPGRVLEVGSGPGGFVAMLQWAGFDATGLELSPWVAAFIRETFEVPVLQGPVEDQRIEPGSLDVIALMDCLEHLPDPAGTMRHCLGLLKPEGLLLIQTPCYTEGRSHEAMLAGGDRFVEMLTPTDHLYLFSRSSIRALFRGIGVEHVAFEPALFAEYDMCVVASRAPLVVRAPADVEAALAARPAGRLVQALLDQAAEHDVLMRRYADAEADRVARLAAIEAQGQRLGRLEAERNQALDEVAALRRQVEIAETDRAARLAIIEAQGQRLGQMEGEQNDLQAEVDTLRGERGALEADRTARLQIIDVLSRRMAEIEADRAARMQVIEAQGSRLREVEAEREEHRQRIAHLEADVVARERANRDLTDQVCRLEELFAIVQRARAYKLLRRLGRWSWMEQASAQIPQDGHR